MTMNRSDMRTWIRLHIELDSADLDDSLIDTHLRAATTKVHSHFSDWQYFQETWTISTAAGTADYSLSTDTTGVGNATSVIAPNGIRSVKRTDGKLARLDYSQLERLDPQENSSGNPRAFAIWGDTITFNPVPSSTETITIRGYREGRDWVGLNEAADVPLDLEEVILFWALGEAYAQQDDAQSSLHWYDMAEHLLERASAKYRNAGYHDDLVMNSMDLGGNHLPSRLKYDFE